MKEQLREVSNRVSTLQQVGSSVEKAARYLNAEFQACFYANKNILWMSYTDGGKPQVRNIGTF